MSSAYVKRILEDQEESDQGKDSKAERTEGKVRRGRERPVLSARLCQGTPLPQLQIISTAGALKAVLP